MDPSAACVPSGLPVSWQPRSLVEGGPQWVQPLLPGLGLSATPGIAKCVCFGTGQHDAICIDTGTIILIELPYPDPPFAAISIETGVPAEILFAIASHIEMN